MCHLAEAIVSSITVAFVASLWLAAKLTKMGLDDERRSDDREIWQKPEMAKAAREAIKKKRDIVLAERSLWFESWDRMSKSGQVGDRRQNCWDNVVRLDGVLKDLADEEAKIPLYDDEKKS